MAPNLLARHWLQLARLSCGLGKSERCLVRGLVKWSDRGFVQQAAGAKETISKIFAIWIPIWVRGDRPPTKNKSLTAR